LVLFVNQPLIIKFGTNQNTTEMKFGKLILPAIIAIIIAIGLSSCTGTKSAEKQPKHSGVEYYRLLQFSETPYDIEKGIHPLTADEAKTVKAYKFTYNDKGQLMSVEYVRNNVPLDYSSMGAAKIDYTYTGDNIQTKKYFNSKNEQIENQGIYAVEYSLNNDGMRVGSMFYDKDGKMVDNRNGIHSYTWTVLPDGMVKENRHNLKGEEVVMNPFCPFYELRFTYNDKGYVTRMANYMADTLYNCTAENCGDIGVSYFTFTPNENGDVEKFEVYNVTGQMSNLYWGWSKRISKFDANGYVTETTYYDQDNEVVGGKLVPTTRYKYDEHGALVETTSYDKDGNLMNNPQNGIAMTQYRYDDAGNRTETLNFDMNNVAVKQ
jgi:YD repeat-containing protein